MLGGLIIGEGRNLLLYAFFNCLHEHLHRRDGFLQMARDFKHVLLVTRVTDVTDRGGGYSVVVSFLPRLGSLPHYCHHSVS